MIIWFEEFSSYFQRQSYLSGKINWMQNRVAKYNLKILINGTLNSTIPNINYSKYAPTNTSGISMFIWIYIQIE